jgi:hypothetical protein
MSSSAQQNLVPTDLVSASKQEAWFASVVFVFLHIMEVTHLCPEMSAHFFTSGGSTLMTES